MYNADIDECALGIDVCSDDATCTDTEGSYECICHPGYTGNGINCTGKSCIAFLLLCVVDHLRIS